MSNSVPSSSASSDDRSIEEQNLRELLQTKLPKHEASAKLVSNICTQIKEDPKA